MSDDINQQENNLDTDVVALKSEIERLRKHNQELLTETKTAEERTQELESQAMLEQNKYKELYEQTLTNKKQINSL